MAKDLERVIGKDIRQATRYAEGKNEEVQNLKAAIQTLEAELKDATQKLETAADEAAEAWDYVSLLKSANP